MSQRINLYHAPAKSLNMGPTFKQMMWGAVGFFSLLMLVSLFDLSQYIKNNYELQDLEKKKEEITSKNKILEQQPAKDVYVAEMKVLQEKEVERKKILDTLVEFKGQEYKGFSPYLKAFSNQVQEGLWLTKFLIREGGAYIGMIGRTIRTRELTAWIAGLGTEPAFKTKTFQVFKVSVDPNVNVLRFVLETKENAALGEDKGAEQQNQELAK